VDGTDHYSFPTLEQILVPTEEDLRLLGYGYRAKFVVNTAKMLKDRGDDWLVGLRGKPRMELQNSLSELSGIGRKVADCIALFSLDALNAIPVDIHVWQITMRDYADEFKPSGSSKTVNKTLYKEISDFWEQKFGAKCGWAQSVLFCADLKAFKHRLGPSDKPTPKRKPRKTLKKGTTKLKAKTPPTKSGLPVTPMKKKLRRSRKSPSTKRKPTTKTTKKRKATKRKSKALKHKVKRCRCGLL
jgi:N-glycosylase/DNA lyase